VAIFAVAAWAIIYSPLITDCCGAFDVPVVALLWSASSIGAVFTGAGNNPGRGEVLIGFIVESLAIWAIVRLGFMAALRKRGSDDV